jgi:hypothetical protein
MPYQSPCTVVSDVRSYLTNDHCAGRDPVWTIDKQHAPPPPQQGCALSSLGISVPGSAIAADELHGSGPVQQVLATLQPNNRIHLLDASTGCSLPEVCAATSGSRTLAAFAV